MPHLRERLVKLLSLPLFILLITSLLVLNVLLKLLSIDKVLFFLLLDHSVGMLGHGVSHLGGTCLKLPLTPLFIGNFQIFAVFSQADVLNYIFLPDDLLPFILFSVVKKDQCSLLPFTCLFSHVLKFVLLNIAFDLLEIFTLVYHLLPESLLFVIEGLFHFNVSDDLILQDLSF